MISDLGRHRVEAPDNPVLRRLIRVPCPFGGHLMVLYDSYSDESWDDLGTNLFCVSGYLIQAQTAESMDARWRATLAQYQLPYFRMTDCAHGNGVFKGISKPDRIAIATAMIDTVVALAACGFSVIVNRKDFDHWPSESDEYTFCLGYFVTRIATFLRSRQIDGKVAFFFEAGHQSSGKAASLMGNLIGDASKELSSMTFAKKAEVALLQSADLLAWQTTKFVKDCVLGARKPRADFLSLMRKRHEFVYVASLNGHNSHFLDTNPGVAKPQKEKRLLKALFSNDRNKHKFIDKNFRTAPEMQAHARKIAGGPWYWHPGVDEIEI